MHSYSTPSSSSTLVLWIRLVVCMIRENRNSYPYYAYYKLVCILLRVLLASTLASSSSAARSVSCEVSIFRLRVSRSLVQT